VVPSPAPLENLEVQAIRMLVSAGCIVAAGGGGIPVVRRDGEFIRVDAVVDKDRASALRAGRLGTEVLVLVTGVDRVCVDFGGPHQRALDVVTAGEVARLADEGHFPTGSMGTKVESALAFLDAGGSTAVITSIELIGESLAGRVDTRITAD
jgi:carbamate kinase